ncbi:MAG: rRNA maturation RNase YbeY [Paludibacteraceae bacterium]|nr:rRNA maturation RNase YbeY [Paludibacteraceae bacterium]
MISFSSIDISMPSLNQELLKQWIEQVAAGYKCRIGTINYLFCTDEHILSVNRQFLSHDYYTDIITFDYSNNHILSGDIVISIDTIRSNAQLLGIEFQDELHRVIIHGVLHLTGQGDKTAEAEKIMHQKEDLALKLLSTLTR